MVGHTMCRRVENEKVEEGKDDENEDVEEASPGRGGRVYFDVDV